MRILLVRHGQASFGADDYDNLSDLGKTQSQLLGQWWAECGIRIDRVVIGSLNRHRQTADACLMGLAGGSAKPVDVDAGFNEYDHNEVIIRLRPDFADPVAMRAHLKKADNPRRAFQEVFQAAMERWIAGLHDANYTESWAGFCGRVRAAFARVIATIESEDRREGDIAVFTSGGPVSAVAQALLDLSDLKTLELSWGLCNAGVTRVNCKRGRGFLVTLNDTAHLDRMRRPDLITYR